MNPGTTSESQRASPPSPPGRPLTGHLHLLTRDPLPTFQRLSREYGDVVSMRAGRYRIVLINDPIDIERLLVSGYGSTVKPELLRRTKETLGEGLLTSDGDHWRRQRRLATPAFRKDALEEYALTMGEITRETVSRWSSTPPSDLHAEMMDLTLRIVTATLFGEEIDRQSVRRVGEILDIVLDRFLDYQTLTWLLFDWFPRPSRQRYRRALAELDEIIYGIIDRRERRGPEERRTLLDRYAEATDDDGSGMSRKDLRDESTTIFLAGHETTANALTFTLDLLARHPEVTERLRREITAGADQPVTIESLRKPSLLRSVIYESLRLFPPAWRVGRELTEDLEFGGYLISAGSQVFASQWTVQRDPRWFSEPDEFRPDRWLPGKDGSPPETELIPRYAFFPFGGGPRLCIGSRFAEFEMMVVLTEIVRKMRPVPVSDDPISLFPTITLRPADAVRLGFTPW